MPEGEVIESGAGAAELTGGDNNGAVTTQPWVAAIEGIPDDLKVDPTINRYEKPVEFIKAHLELRKVASSKLAVPAADAAPEAWNPVYDALGRPKTPAEYDFGLEALPDNADDAAKTARAEMTKRYADLMHPLGLNNAQAKALVAADIARINEATKAYFAKGDAEIDALKAEMGADYEPQKAAAHKMLVQLFGEETAGFADALETKVGSAALLKGMMKLAKVAGEHIRVDGLGGDFKDGGENPQAQLDARMADKSWREKYNAGDVATVAEYTRLLGAATKRATAT
jgi:hypothetical protein